MLKAYKGQPYSFPSTLSAYTDEVEQSGEVSFSGRKRVVMKSRGLLIPALLRPERNLSALLHQPVKRQGGVHPVSRSVAFV